MLLAASEARNTIAAACSERAGLPSDDLRPTVQAALFNAALRAVVEHHAGTPARPPTP